MRSSATKHDAPAQLPSTARGERPGPRRISLLPEAGVLLGAFLLSLPWEAWLMGRQLAMDPHAVAAREVLWLPVVAAFAHALLVLIAFEVVALAVRDRRWLLQVTWGLVALFVTAALVVTLIAESMASLFLEGWEHMWVLPTLALPGTRVASLVQTTLVPLALGAGAEWRRRVRARRPGGQQ